MPAASQSGARLRCGVGAAMENVEDVRKALAYARQHQESVTFRAAGTSAARPAHGMRCLLHQSRRGRSGRHGCSADTAERGGSGLRHRGWICCIPLERAVSTFFGEIADELLQSTYPIGPRTFYKSLDVGRRAGAAVAFAGGENWSDRQTLDRFGEEQRLRGRACTSPDVMQDRQRSTSKRMPRKSWTQFRLLPWHIPEFFMLVTHRPVR